MKTAWLVTCAMAALGTAALGQGRSVPKPEAWRGDPQLVQPEFSGDTTVFVPNPNPIFIRGKRIDAANGGHTVTVRHTEGMEQDGVPVIGAIFVDGVVYSVATPDPPSPPPWPKMEDGFFYYVTTAASLMGYEAVKSGKTPEEARRIMLDFWAQYADSLEVEAGQWDAEVTYRGDTILIPFPKPIPENLPPRPDPFERLLRVAEGLVSDLNAGLMLICGKATTTRIQPEDVRQALEDISRLPSRAEVWGRLGEEVVYRGMAIVGGKYRLSPIVVGDLIRKQ